MTGTIVFYPSETPNNKIKQFNTRLELNKHSLILVISIDQQTGIKKTL